MQTISSSGSSIDPIKVDSPAEPVEPSGGFVQEIQVLRQRVAELEAQLGQRAEAAPNIESDASPIGNCRRTREPGSPVDAEAPYRQAVMREVHHRFKNYLHGVLGLLRLERTRAPAEAAAVLLSAENRLRSIADTFGLRAGSESGLVDADRLVRAIVEGASGVRGAPIDFEADPGAARWRIADGTTLAAALLIEEVVGNAIRHQTVSSSPVVRLRTRLNGLTLSVSNPGQLPGNFGSEQPSEAGFGLRLARMMAREQHGLRLGHESRDGRVVATLDFDPPSIEPVDMAPGA